MKPMQMCANERCPNVVPAQLGPKLCPACVKAGVKLSFKLLGRND